MMIETKLKLAKARSYSDLKKNISLTTQYSSKPKLSDFFKKKNLKFSNRRCSDVVKTEISLSNHKKNSLFFLKKNTMKKKYLDSPTKRAYLSQNISKSRSKGKIMDKKNLEFFRKKLFQERKNSDVLVKKKCEVEVLKVII